MGRGTSLRPWYSQPSALHIPTRRRRRRPLTALVPFALVLALAGGVFAATAFELPEQTRALTGGGTRYPATLSDIAAGCTGELVFMVEPATFQVAPGEQVTYTRLPPLSGAWTEPAAQPGFYSAESPPDLTAIVASLRHGYIVLWYRAGIDEGTLASARRVIDASEYANYTLIVPLTPGTTLLGERPMELSSWTRAKDCRTLTPDIFDDFAAQALLNPLAQGLRPDAVTQ